MKQTDNEKVNLFIERAVMFVVLLFMFMFYGESFTLMLPFV